MMGETEGYAWEKRYRALVDVLTEEFPPQTVTRILGKMNRRINE